MSLPTIIAGTKGKSFTVAKLEAAGARRISLATLFYRIAMAGLVETPREGAPWVIATPGLAAFRLG
jgi:hypothetical protein